MSVIGLNIRDASGPVQLPHGAVAPYEARAASYGAEMSGQIVPIRVGARISWADPGLHLWKEDLSGISAVHDFNFHRTRLQKKLNKKEKRIMHAINDFINNASLTKRSKWILPALIALAAVIAFLGVTGCSPPHHTP